MADCIDSHNHLWRYKREEFPWISKGMEVLRRDYMLKDLSTVTAAAGVTGTIVVEARQITAETEWLLELAEDSELIRGVVGWAPLVDEGVEKYLAKVAQRGKLKGLRHVLHDEEDENYILREDFNRGIAVLRHYQLSYDILIFERHLPQAISFVDQHPNQVFILDHIAKPLIRGGVIYPWNKNLRELARRENVYCKLSGVVTEADWKQWSEKELRPYMDTVLNCFGAQRLMFGSDWPVLNVASNYSRWLEIVKGLIADLSSVEQARIMAGTAVEAYGL